ncbi:SymE family type I addiction module toxin [Dyadobacter sediminis]|uniref:Type I toxin-antitoxin system SymE family toxin n=1 Tax=Dyadobacter sediminis TaxID=1493691 RepID=A0A5R9K9W0_9BACT|nr:SymE family type I addiction module toxin [Dyadobacter sediminis]TLU91610.1 type I toxin-antitoxin system SymE family toxin [Dyadobacter sediminis]
MKQVQSFTRQLKIYYKFQTTSSYQFKIVPEIRLCGKWLQEIGFDHGQLITVRLEDNRLIIEHTM